MARIEPKHVAGSNNVNIPLTLITINWVPLDYIFCSLYTYNTIMLPSDYFSIHLKHIQSPWRWRQYVTPKPGKKPWRHGTKDRKTTIICKGFTFGRITEGGQLLQTLITAQRPALLQCFCPSLHVKLGEVGRLPVINAQCAVHRQGCRPHIRSTRDSLSKSSALIDIWWGKRGPRVKVSWHLPGYDCGIG